MQYSARPWQNTKSTVTPPLQTPVLCSFCPESRVAQAAHAILRTSPADSLGLTPSAYTQSLTAFSLTKPSFAWRRRRWLLSPVTELALLQLSECPATLQASSTAALYPLESTSLPSLHPRALLSC